ncbi:MAG: hypothetical protein JWN89_268 [Parcubacteria group bacterium]|nr:hypothetical protein [Parcubacteria group bacterium]
MRELQEKQKRKERLYSTPVLIGLSLITLLVLRGTFVIMQKERESSTYVGSLEEKVTTLADRQAKLKTDTARLSTDEGIDTEIKTRFSVAKAGEHVVVIVDPKEKASTTEPKSGPWYQGVVSFLKSLW